MSRYTLVGYMIVLVSLPCRAEVVVTISPSSMIGLTGEPATVNLTVDVGSQSLGGYGAILAWDPTVLEFLGWAGGAPPFNTPVVNSGSAGSGMLSAADSAAIGAQGPLIVLEVTFKVIGLPPATSVLDLELTSLYRAGDFEDLVPQSTVGDGSTCVTDFAYNLELDGSQSTILTWTLIPQAVSYDVIRGDLNGLVVDATSVHLGTVTCLEDDSADTTTGPGTEPANADVDIPLEGEGFFYLVRFNDGTSNRTYGYFEDCSLQRLVDSADCP